MRMINFDAPGRMWIGSYAKWQPCIRPRDARGEVGEAGERCRTADRRRQSRLRADRLAAGSDGNGLAAER